MDGVKEEAEGVVWLLCGCYCFVCVIDVEVTTDEIWWMFARLVMR